MVGPRVAMQAGQLVICLTILTLAIAPRVSATTRCLTPDTGRVITDVLATGAVQRRLPNGVAIENVEIGGQEIALSVLDPQHVRYEVRLQVAPTTRRAGKTGGRNFTFAIADTPNPPAQELADALFAAAGLLDDGIPDSLLVDCSSRAGDPGGRSGGPDASHALTLPPALALVSAVAEVSIIIAAIVFGIGAIARGPDTDPPC
jgi:hypothetical protein